MDEITRRQITWIVIITAALSLLVYAGGQRRLVPDALEQLSRGNLAQQIAAIQVLAERGKVAEALKEQPRWVQVATVKALLQIATPQAVQQLAETVPLLDEPVAKWATEALASYGRLAIGPLVECMQNKDGGVRAAATGPLIKIGGTPEGGEAVIAAVSPFMGAYDDYVRAGVTTVLSALGKPAAPVAINMLLRDRPAPDQTSAAFTRAQDCAVEILVAMKEPALEPIIAQLVPHRREKVRAIAALMLGRIAGGLGPKAGAAVPPLLRLIADDNWSVRRRAAAGLGELGPQGQLPEVLAALTARLQDNTEVKAAAVKSLGMIAAPSSASALVQTLLVNREGVGQDLVTALQSLGPAALPALTSALAAGDVGARELATQAVARIGTPAAVPLLAARLSDPAVTVQRVAAAALETQATPEIAGALSQALGSPDPLVYGAVSRAFLYLGAQAVPPLIARLGSGDPRVALVATEALTAVGPPAVPALAEALRSSNAFTREWAAVALGELGRSALPATVAILQDGAAPVEAREAAAEALGRSRLPEAVAPLSEAAMAAAFSLRRAALQALAETRQPDASTALVKAIADSDGAIAMAALRLLLDWQVGDTDKQLRGVLTSGDEQAQRRAAIALAFHASPGATPLLGALFGTPAAAATSDGSEIAPILNRTASDPAASPELRRLAIIGLAYSGSRDSVDTLNAFLTPHDPLAPTAARALGILGGRLSDRGGASETAAQAAVDRLMQVFEQTNDDSLRLQAATALSLMRGAPVADLLSKLNTVPEPLKPWIAAILGAIGKPANEGAMRERGRETVAKAWASASVFLIGDPESLKFLQRLPASEQPEREKIQAARALYDRIMAVRATPFV